VRGTCASGRNARVFHEGEANRESEAKFRFGQPNRGKDKERGGILHSRNRREKIKNKQRG